MWHVDGWTGTSLLDAADRIAERGKPDGRSLEMRGERTWTVMW